MNEPNDRAAWFNGGAPFCDKLPAPPKQPDRLVLLGAPGVGKGTQAELLCARLGACHLSTGDVFRAARGLTDGQLSAELEEALGFMRRGELIPDDIVLAVLRQRGRCLRCPVGFVLDGFPRTVAQAEALHKMLGTENLALSAVIHYQLPLGQIIARLSGRRICATCKAVFHVTERPPRVTDVCDHCGLKLYQREDDNPESIRMRIKCYEESAAPLLDFYRTQGLLVSIETTTPEETLQRTIMALDSRNGLVFSNGRGEKADALP
jgi:adenylate kinase